MKNSHKGFALLTMLLIAAGVLVAGGAGYWYYQSQNKAPELIGGQKDEHGCLGPAGYSWCEVKQKCLRVWEEPCEATSTTQTSQTSNLTLPDINNAIYTIDGDTKAQFSNGQFQPQENSALSNGGLNSVVGDYALGDINHDGRGDAVVVTVSGIGARDARMSELQIVLNINGKPQTRNTAVPLRTGEHNQIVIGIKTISIDSSGIITLQVYTHSVNDDNVYNSTQVIRRYSYDGNSLIDIGTN